MTDSKAELAEEKLKGIELRLTLAVKAVKTCDKPKLIDRAVDHLKHAVPEKPGIVGIVILIFQWRLWNEIFPSMSSR